MDLLAPGHDTILQRLGSATRILVALLCAGALLAGCSGGGEDASNRPSAESPSTSLSASVTEPAGAAGAVDQVAHKVPLAGTKEVRVLWEPKSLDVEADPVVEVARRFEQLYQLGYYQPGWTSKPQMRRWVDALSVPGVVPDRTLRYWHRKDTTQPGTITILMSAPERLTEQTARVFSCVDAREILDTKSPGTMREYTLELDGPYWRVVDYEVRLPDTPPDFFDRCREGR